MNRLNNRQSARICVLVTVGFAFLTMALSSHASEIVLPTDTAASVEAPPSAPPPPPTTPPAPTTPHPKLAKEVADYKETMVEMQRELAEFKRYYDPSPKLSRLGQWSNQIPHLNAAWTAKVRAPDNDTRTKCERLQRKIRELLSSLKKTAKLIVKYAADPAQADSARVTSQSEAIAGLYLAIDKDDVREFDRWDPIVLGY